MSSTAGLMISVETVLQADRLAREPAAGDAGGNAGGNARGDAGCDAGGDGAATAALAGIAPWPIVRQQHRVAAGTTIRALLVRAGLQRVVASIESGAVGLALHGRRAWLDDALRDGSRVEVLEPINADAKAARAERVAADRGRRSARFGAGR